MKSVLISIQPKWCELIASGKKTVEVRKTKPKLKTPFKVYIYCTGNKNKKIGSWLSLYCDSGQISTDIKLEEPCYQLNGKVIGEFVCNNIDNRTLSNLIVKEDAEHTLSGTCLTKNEVLDYLGYQKGTSIYDCKNFGFYGWHISDLIIYDKPKELSEFFVYCDRCDKRPIACKFAYEESNENGYYSECMCDFKRPIERPPQSWCYVESQS